MRRYASWCAGIAGLWLVAVGQAGALEVRVVALFDGKALLEVEGARQMLSTGERSPQGVKLVSANSDQAVLEINGRRSTHGLGENASISTSFTAPPAGRSVSIWPDEAGMYRSNGYINGQPVNFLIDTGATTVSMNRKDAKRLGIDYRYLGKLVRVNTASGEDKGYLLKLDSVRLGDIELRDIAAIVHDGDSPPFVLLGNSFLNKLDLQRNGQEMRLTRK